VITKLRIKNFKSFQDTGELNLRPLTFLMGPNSSGKTSLLQVLLMLRQTVDSRDLRNPLEINGSYVDLGSYQTMVYKHELKRKLTVELSFSLRALDEEVNSTLDYLGAGKITQATMRGIFKYNKSSQRIYCDEYSLYSEPPTSGFKRSHIKGELYSFQSILPALDGTILTVPVRESTGTLKFFLPTVVIPSKTLTSKKLLGLSDDISISRYLNNALEVLVSLADSPLGLFEQLFYIGPIRESPQPFYLITGETPQDVGIKGEKSVQVLQSSYGEQKSELLDKVNKWMASFSIAEKVNLKGIGSSLSELVITDPNTRVEVNLAHVGFGASQVLPIIVEGFYSSPGSTLLIEQPEIHLHPRAQSVMADLLIDIAKEDKAIIVETHSEHIISRIQRRIAEGKINRDEVAIYYFHPTEDGTEIEEVQMNDLGQFDKGLPEGFFDEGFKESMRYLESLHRHHKQNQ